MKLFSKGEQGSGCGAGRNSQIAGQRMSAKGKSQHAGDRGGRRESSNRLFFVASEDCNDSCIGGEAKAENDPADGAPDIARCL